MCSSFNGQKLSAEKGREMKGWADGDVMVVVLCYTDQKNKKYNLDTGCSFLWHRPLRRTLHLSVLYSAKSATVYPEH
jgi:hypothetical protein